MFGKFLVAWIATMSDIVAYIGDRVQDNETAQTMPRPYVVYTKVGSNPIADLSGPSGLNDESWQLSIIANTYAQARAIADLISGTRTLRRLDGYSGVLAGVSVRRCLLSDERDIHYSPVDGSARGVREIQQDYSVAIDRAYTA